MVHPYPAVSLVIRAYNEEEMLPKCLAAIARQTLQPDEIILVLDKRSSDRTQLIAVEHGLRIIEIAKFSFGRALNMGIAAAHGELIALLSAHAIPADEHWLAELVAPFPDHERVAACTSRQIAHPEHPWCLQRLMRRYFPRDEVGRVQLSNSAACLRRVCWEQHPFDENVSGAEDLLWAVDLRKRGWSFLYRANSRVFHSHLESLAVVRQRIFREAASLEREFSLTKLAFGAIMQFFLDFVPSLREGRRSLLASAACHGGCFLGHWDVWRSRRSGKWN